METERCNHETLNNRPCKLPAGWGTDHKGRGFCKRHDHAAQRRLDMRKEEILHLIESSDMSFTSAASRVGIGIVQLWRWRQADPEFARQFEEALQTRKYCQMLMVEDSLFRTLIGGNASAGHYKLWLTNKAKDEWKDRWSGELTGASGEPLLGIETVRAIVDGVRRSDERDDQGGDGD